MSTNVSNSLEFVRQLRRRLILAAFVDRLGLLALCTSLASIILLPIGIFLPAATTVTLAAISIVAIFTGVALAIRPWPTLLVAGALADRELHLDDLLTTILNLGPVPFDDLSTVVREIADARCRQFSPSQVLIPRLSAKAWSGITLATAAAIALAVVPLRPGSSQHADADTNVLASAVDVRPAMEPSQSQSIPGAGRSDPIGEGESQISAATDVESPIHAGTSNHTSPPPPGGGDASVGKGASASNRPIASATPDTASAAGHSTDGGDISSGAGRESTQQRSGTDIVAGTVGGRTPRATIPPWRSTDWPAARAAALSPVRANSVPPPYRDLVRGYFQQ